MRIELHLMKMLSLRKAPLSFIMKHVTECQNITVGGLHFSTRPQCREYCNNANLRSNSEFIQKVNQKKLLPRILRKIGVNTQKYQLMAVGYYIYEDVVHGVNYASFFKDFNMKDTFHSWFMITELHVWMLMLRYMVEGENGKLVRNNLIEAMWKDIDVRVDKLGPIHPTIKRKQITDLSYQFNAALLSYDEGILSDDKVLAGALWRTFFASECNNPEHLERLVAYVRKQVNSLDNVPSDEILIRKKINWVNFSALR